MENEMTRYKICPSCKTKNHPQLFECSNCEMDLSRVDITDEKTENANQKAENNVTSETVKFVRICECGAKNTPNATQCSVCKEDISDITPTSDLSEKKAKNIFVLSSTDGEYAFKLPEGKTQVGRECSMSEYLLAKRYVSRIHAVFTQSLEQLYIENVSTTNFTYVNNIKITQKTELYDGDEIGFGGTSVNGNRQNDAAYFLVKIDLCM